MNVVESATPGISDQPEIRANGGVNESAYLKPPNPYLKAMKRIHTLGIVVAVILLVFVYATGCDSVSDSPALDSVSLESIAESQVRSVTVQPMTPQSDPPSYLLTVVIEPDANRLSLPSAINVLSQGPGLPNTTIEDTGQGVDVTAGDGVFTGIVPLACIAEIADELPGPGKLNEFNCKFEIVAPGSECGTYGECPRRAHRSFLWGLIEYDTDILFCFCLIECEIGN